MKVPIQFATGAWVPEKASVNRPITGSEASVNTKKNSPITGSEWPSNTKTNRPITGSESSVSSKKNTPITGSEWPSNTKTNRPITGSESSTSKTLNEVILNNKNKNGKVNTNETGNSGSQKVNYNNSGNTSNINSNTSHSGTSKTESGSLDENKNDTIKSELKKDETKVDTGKLNQEYTFDGLTNEEQKEINDNINILTEKFEKIIPDDNKDKAELVQEFKDYLYNKASNIISNKSSNDKVDISEINTEIEKIANEICSSDVSDVKAKLKNYIDKEMSLKYENADVQNDEKKAESINKQINNIEIIDSKETKEE